MDYILDNLAVGHYQEALNPPQEISALLCVAGERGLTNTDKLYFYVPMADMTPIPVTQLKDAVEWIKSNIHAHKIMVYCNAGVGRSPSVVIAYLCCVLGYGFGEAVEFVAVKKPYMSILPLLIERISEVKASMDRN